MNIKKWIKNNTENLNGKTVAITGATGSLGTAVSLYLAGLGANLIFIDRNEQKSLNLKSKIQEKYKKIKIENLICDMENINSVKNVCELLKTKKVDYFIFNAGAYRIPRKKNNFGFNNVFQINFISPYYMMNELKSNITKVIIVGSIAHKICRFNENDIDCGAKNKPIKIYGNSKRFLIFSSKCFAEENNLKLAVVHPGIVYSKLSSNFNILIKWIIVIFMKLFFMKPKKASLVVLKGMFCDCKSDEWVGPRFFDVWGKPKIKKLKIDKQEKQKMFNIAQNILNKIDID